MNYQSLIQNTHENFIKFIYASVMVQETDVKHKLNDIALFKYRHMVWLMQDAVNDQKSFNMDFEYENIAKIKKVKNSEDLIEILKEDLDSSLGLYAGINNPTINRLRSDDSYFIEELGRVDVESEITAFNENKKLPGIEISDESKSALIFFLMEETFKEYELVTIYSYLKVHSNIAVADAAFTDLAYDSIYHLKRFADLASKMGVLTLPRPLPHDKYENIGIIEFLKENIEEEMDAEKQCLILAEKIGNKELSDFLLFISRQELYHGELLQRALNSINS